MSDYASELAELMPEKAIAPRQGIGINVRRLLKLRGRLMALVFIALFLPVMAAIWVLVPKYYVAVGNVKFKATSPQILGGEGRALTGTSYDIFVNTQIEYITGPAFVDVLLRDAELQQKLPRIVRLPNARAHIMEHLEAEIVPRTELVTLTYRDEDRDAALLMMNKILETYEAELRREVLDRGGYARKTLEERLETVMKELEEDQKRIADERAARGIPVGEVPGQEPVETESIRMNLAQAEADLSRAEIALEQTRKLQGEVDRFLAEYEANPANPIYAMGVEEKVSAHPSVVFLVEQLAQQQQEFSVLEDRYVEGAPQVAVKQRELAALEAKVEGARAQARGEALRSVAAQYGYDLERAEAEIQEARTRRDKFLASLAEYETKAVARSQGLAVIQEMERQAEEKRGRIQQMRNELFRIDLESNAPAQVTPERSAWADHRPDYRQRIKYAAVALFAAFLISLVSGVVLEMNDQNIRSSEDVAYVTKLPVIANIAHAVEDRLPDHVRVGSIAQEYPDSYSADEFRRAAARIIAPDGGVGIKSCMVTSASRGDGKTIVACNLAIVLARAGRRVLLVDLDSHNPGVERTFGLRPSVGLAELLSGEPLRHDPDQATDIENLYVLGPGLNNRELLSRLASREMSDFLAGAEEVFDHVIVDAPAVLLMSEARLLAPMVDGVVVVIGAGVTSFGMLRRCLRTIEETNGRVLGLVLNGLRQSPFGYLRRNLAMYYDEGPGCPRRTVVPGPARQRSSSGQSIVLLRDASRSDPEV